MSALNTLRRLIAVFIMMATLTGGAALVSAAPAGACGYNGYYGCSNEVAAPAGSTIQSNNYRYVWTVYYW